MSRLERHQLGSLARAFHRTQHFPALTLAEGLAEVPAVQGPWIWSDDSTHVWSDDELAAWTESGTLAMQWEDGQGIQWEDGEPIEWEPNSPVTPPPPSPEPDLSPAPFTFSPRNGLSQASFFSCQHTITVQGVDGTQDIGGQEQPLGIPISVSGTAPQASYSINGGPFTSSPGFVYLGDTVRPGGMSAAGFSLTNYVDILIYDQTGRFSMSTSPAPTPDTTPNAFAFTDVPAAELSTVHSDSVVITGINSPTPVELVLSHATSAGRFRIGTGPWFPGVLVPGSGTSPTVVSGETVTVEMTSAASYVVTHTGTLTVGGESDAWLVTTKAAPVSDAIPDPFDFGPPLTGVPISTTQTSTPITVSGVNVPILAEVYGDASSLMSINGAPYTSTSTMVNNGDQIVVCHMSSAAFSTSVTTTLELGGLEQDDFVTTTAASPGSSSFTPLAAPSWLIDAGYPENHVYTKNGYDYIKATYETRFPWDAGIGGGTVTTVNNTTEFAAAVAAAKTNSTIKGIHLNPGDYSYALNLLSGLNRTATNCLFIRTTLGAGAQARFPSQIVQQDGNVKGVAFCDIEIPNGLRFVGSFTSGGPFYEDILVERCKGYVVFEGQRLGSGGAETGRPCVNIQLRLNDFSDHWGSPGNNLTHGVFVYNVDGLLQEGNIYHHNGWIPTGTRATLETAGGPNGRKHNVYVSRPSGHDGSIVQTPVARFNFNSMPSSHGFHMKGGAITFCNIFSNCPIAYQNGYGQNDGIGTLYSLYGVADDTQFYDNMILGSDDIRTTGPNQPMGIGVWCACNSNALIENNYFLYDRTSAVNGATVRVERTFPVEVDISNNIALSWNGNVVQLGVDNYTPVITGSGNDWSAASITAPAQTLAYQLGADPTLANYVTWIAGYRNTRHRKGVDILELQGWINTIRTGITP